MRLSEFKNHLSSFPDHELRFILPDGGMIEAHAHITEVGRIEKTFIDCGGTIRRTICCSLQAWVADDIEHRLAPKRLASIIEKAAPILGDDELEVEIEYQDCLISQFPVASASTEGSALFFHLTEKHTDCLAKDICLPRTPTDCCNGNACC